MVISYKTTTLRTGWDAAEKGPKKDRYAAWALDFEKEIENQCDAAGIDPSILGINIDEVNSGANLKISPRDLARKMILKAKRRLRMI